jgi:uncharacterized protein involved in exopolysaccharide biosynthesis
MSDPELAAGIANRVVELTVERSTRVEQAEESGERALLRAQLDEATRNLEAIQEKLLIARAEGQLEALKQEHQNGSTASDKAARGIIEIEAEKARLRKAEAELAKIPPGARLRGTLEKHVTESRNRLAGLQSKQRALMTSLDDEDPVLRQLRDVYAREMSLARLEVEHDVARKIYEENARKYHVARLDTLVRATVLEAVDPASTPSRPAFPRPERILPIAVLGGFIVSLIGIFVLNALRGGWSTAGRTNAVSRDAAASTAPSGEESRLRGVERRNGV